MKSTGFLGRVSVYGLGSGALAVLRLLLIPMFTRLLSPAEFGVYTALYALISLLSFLCLLGLDEATSREYYDHGPQSSALGSFVWNIVTAVIGLAVLMGLGALGLAATDLLKPETATLVRHYGLPILGIGLLTSLMGLFNVLLVASQKATKYVTSQGIRMLAMVALTLALLAWTRLGVVAVLWGEGISLLFLLAWLGWEFSRSHGWPGAAAFIGLPKAGATLRYALPFVLYSLTNWSLSASDRLILARFCSLDELGRYGLGYTLATGMNTIVLTGVNMAYAPLFLRRAKEQEDHPALYARDLELYTVAVGYLTLGAMLLAPEVVRIIAPSRYQGAAPIMRVVVFAFLMLGMYLMNSLPLVLHRKSSSIALGSFLAALVNAGLNVALVPRYGIITAAWTTVIGYLVMALFARWKSRAHYPAPVREVRVWIPVLAVMGLGLAAQAWPLAGRIVLLLATGLLTGWVAWKRLKAPGGASLLS